MDEGLANEHAMHRETVDLLGRCGVSSEKSPFSADLPKVHRSSTERPGSKQAENQPAIIFGGLP